MAERLTKTKILEILDRHQLGPSRALGQNFLCDGLMIDKIVRLARVKPDDRVIEIGPGLGSLTLGLLDAGASVEAIEIDKYLIPALKETVGGHQSDGRIQVHNCDIRDFDWSPVQSSGVPWSVVANLPYNIATPLILDLLAERPELTRFLVMVQREAGERLVATPGSKIYGIPSVLAGFWATGRIVGSVKAELFYPRPKVESVLVELQRNADRPSSDLYPDLQKVVKAGFGQRRKMIRRSLAGILTSEQLEAAGVVPTMRAEEIELDQWIQLARQRQSGGSTLEL